MKLNDILKKVSYEVIQGNADIEIENICYDSRAIKPGDVFFCIQGFKMDGHEYAGQAIEKRCYCHSVFKTH